MALRRIKTFIGRRSKRAFQRLVTPFSPRPFHLVEENGFVWRTTGQDPQFVFPAPPRDAKLAFLFVGERDAALTPRLYLDWGDGFSEASSVHFGNVRAALIRFDCSNCPDLRSLRLDPHEGFSGSFVFRWGAGRKGEALAREAQTEFADWEARRAQALRADLRAADYAPARPGRPIGVRRHPQTVEEHFQKATELAGQQLADRLPAPRATPLISLVSPLYDTPVAYLDDLLASFRKQAPGLAELVLSDDGSKSPATAAWLDAHEKEPGVVVLRNGVNRGIASACNAGAAAAKGGWITFIDHDDMLADHAIAVIVEAIEENPGARFFYTDEVMTDARMRPFEFFDKPAFDDVMLSGVNYINHFSIYARDLFESVGGFREGFDGSQDYDLLLRALRRLARDQIRHIPYPAYLWRRDGRTYSVKFLEKATANARRALAEAYARPGEALKVEPALRADLHRLRLDLVAPKPKVSIVVPNRDAFRLMSVLTEGLFGRTDYPDFELIVVDNGTTDPDTLALYETLKRDHANVRIEIAPGPFNFSAQVNRGIALSTGEAVLLLNNDIEVQEPDWLAEMVGCLAFEDAGIVGARLLYPSGEIQHVGVAVGVRFGAAHLYIRRPSDFHGSMGRLAVRTAATAVTGACMLISRACLDAVGPFDEKKFAVAFNDIDYCMRARAAGFRTIFTPFATLVHHESATRGPDTMGAALPRFLREQAELLERYAREDFLDPVLSPWRDRETSEPARILLKALPKAR
jgi:GT2 family glycosyltransferase